MINAKKEVMKAYKKGYAIGSFNVCNLETFQAVVNASNETKQPVFLSTSNASIKYMNFDNIIRLGENLKKLKVFLHLDHGSYENAKKCINSGAYKSVMFDGSSLPLGQNIKKTKEIAKLAHRKGLIAEGEVGILDNKSLTNINDASEFAKKTNIDLMAVSIGNMHGFYKYMPVLDLERLSKINESIKTPLVLHGASGLDENTIQIAVKSGICKINIDTELRWIYTEEVNNYMKTRVISRLDKNSLDIRSYSSIAREAFKNEIIKKIKLFRP